MSRPLTLDEIYAALKRDYNIERDELNTLGFSTEEKVREYYVNVARASADLDVSIEGDTEAEPEDTFKLDAKMRRDYRVFSEQEKAEEAAKRREQLAKSGHTPGDLSHLPATHQVSEAECKAAMDDLFGKPKKKSKAISGKTKKS